VLNMMAPSKNNKSSYWP